MDGTLVEIETTHGVLVDIVLESTDHMTEKEITIEIEVSIIIIIVMSRTVLWIPSS